MEKRINITCQTCHTNHSVPRTSEIPDHVVSMGCNWCPKCEDRAEDYYEEWYNESDNNESLGEDNPTQLVMPFLIEDVPIKKAEPIDNHEN